MRILRTDRLVLEPLQEAHASEMFRVLVDPIIHTFLQERPPFTEDELRARNRLLEKRKSPDGANDLFSWVVRDIGGEMFGFVTATVFARGTAELAVVLSPRVWRKGYAREALGTVMKDLQKRHRVNAFFATAAPRNDPAIKLFQRLGFRLGDRADFDVRPVGEGELLFTAGRGAASPP